MNTLLSNIGKIITWQSERQSMIIDSESDIMIEDSLIIKIGQNLGHADHIIDCQGKMVSPGFIDSHTHPVFMNGREEEFQMRLQGATYEEIALAGGGIVSSINGVREATVDELIGKVQNRMDTFLSLGTTTVEAKSGYGLDLESELKSLYVSDKVNQQHNIDIHPTFMGAHAFPPEYLENKDAYVENICQDMIPKVAEQGIAEYCDVFCEKGYFSVEQSRKILHTAKQYKLKIRLHADEFVDSGAAELAGEMKACSADHLMAISDAGIQSLKDNQVVATLLPGTTFFLGKSSYAPYKKLKLAGIDIALATDFNPGSCYIQSMPFIVSLACIYLKMDILEAFKACTINGAKALELENGVGSLEIGKKADIVIWNVEDPVEIPYNVKESLIRDVIKNGKSVK
ncbi:MAG: imidazolonepropionase [Candidatus Marinimicrobia bacterium]|nr:imidazolonepropionase [Candidatus Neomarinimicrobiota bacterium]